MMCLAMKTIARDHIAKDVFEENLTYIIKIQVTIFGTQST